jgi:replicative DNA helicase
VSTDLASEPFADDYAAEPHDIAAEQAVLGAMMLSEASAAACLSALAAPDFYRPAHQVIFAAVADLIRSGERADTITVKDRLLASGELQRLSRGPLYLADILAAVPATANALHYARIVRDRAVRRRLLLAGRRVVQLASTPGEEAGGLTERALREVESVRDAGLDDSLTVQTITEFLGVSEADDAYDWVIPDLIERGDRMMLTGMEGAGKSTLFRQVAVMTAAGIHPFTRRPMQPQRVLVVDCENGARHTRRKIRPLIELAADLGHEVAEASLWIECRPGGMDLAQDKDVSWLLRQVAAIQPDVTFLGPLYRLAPRALNTDDEAAPVIAALNMIRARGSAVFLEAHAGHGLGPGGRRDLRPRGSSAFLGWPEFGYGLRFSDDKESKTRKVVDLVGWRGDRDERDWPEMLAAGRDWPWVPHTKAEAPEGDDSWSPSERWTG